ncbi:hypothetical protein JCM21900_005508 [Sporobolomyces salmonicolor]
MSRPPAQATTRPITSFDLGSPTPPPGDPAPTACTTSSSSNGKRRATEAEQAAWARAQAEPQRQCELRVAKQSSARVYKPLNSFAPAGFLSNPMPAEPSAPSRRKLPPKPPPPPPRPVAANAPPPKRQKRTLATQEEQHERRKEEERVKRWKERSGAEGRGLEEPAKVRRKEIAASRPLTSFGPRPPSAAPPAPPIKNPPPLPPAPKRLQAVSAFSPIPRVPSPAKPTVGTPVSQRVMQLFGSVGDHKPDAKLRGAKKLLATVPPPQTVQYEHVEEEEEDVQMWSPRKKKGGYLLSGIALRASSVLSAARTEQALWLHDLSRQLATLVSSGPLSRSQLANILQPAVRLFILELPSLSAQEDDPAASSINRRRDRRTALALCRLDVSDLADPPPTDLDETLPTSAAPQRDLEGLVLFSLHSSPSAPSSSRPLPAAPGNPSRTTSRSLFVPSNPHDFRLLRPGSEIWVWEPFHEVTLAASASADWAIRSRGAEDKRQGEEEGDGQGDVFWDSKPLEERERERVERVRKAREGDRSRKGIVCGRFGIVV